MNLYFSYNGADQLIQMKTIQDSYNLLCSNVYWREKMFKNAKLLSKRLFIFDSGAFTTWKTGGSIVLKDYIRTCKKLNDNFEGKIIFINLDEIPGKFGVSPTVAQVKDACQTSWDNYMTMKKELPGIKIMPVFHQHDEWEWLDRYMEQEPPILGISPANDLTSKQRVPFLNRCFRITRDIQPTHGLAVTAPFLLKKYPFYSVDSATWIFSAGIGNFYTFEKGNVKVSHYTKKESIIKNNALHFVDQGSPLYTVRRGQNIKAFLQLEKYITDLWNERGVQWKEI